MGTWKTARGRGSDVSTSPLTLKYMNDNIDKYHAFANRGQVAEQDDSGA